MSIKIQSIHFDADKKLLDFIEERVAKLRRYNDTIMDSSVILRLEKDQDKENKITEIKLLSPGQEFFAKKQCRTFEEATDLVVEALETQIKKHKEKLKG